MAPIGSARIQAVRAARQHLAPSTRGRTEADYLRFVRELGPVRPPAYEFPGTPAVLFDRFDEDMRALAERVRRKGKVFKGRFQHGNIAYVALADLNLYWSAFRKEAGHGADERRILETLERSGPLHRSDLADEAGLGGRRLSRALHRLQLGFRVYEAQLETEWDCPWGAFDSDHGPAVASAPRRDEARREALGRFTHAHVFTSVVEAAEWSGWPRRECALHLAELVGAGHLRRATVAGWGSHYLSADFEPVPRERSVAVLDAGDPLVAPKWRAINARHPGVPVLKYVVLNGAIAGVVEGRWGIRPFDVHDVQVPPAAARGRTREAIIERLRKLYPPPAQRILNFAGRPLDAA
jgi:hypothetical protein